MDRLALYTAAAALMLLAWLWHTWRLHRQNLVNRRGALVPLGIALLWVGLWVDNVSLLGLGIGLAFIGELWPDVRLRRARNKPPVVRTFPRWQAAQEPPRPDIELHLEETGARVQNIGAGALYLHGWSPADQNGWLSLRADDGSGTPISALHKGEWARLSPWTIPNRGVRVWYTRADDPRQQWIFRADWQDVKFGRSGRELN